MDQISKAEQLKLPEQLYVLLIDPDSGEPKYHRQSVEHAIATSIVWELINAGAFTTVGNTIQKVNQVVFAEDYLRRAALHANSRLPIDGSRLIWDIAAELHPVWGAVGKDMVAQHLLTEDVQTRFLIFHKRVLTELGDARRDSMQLSKNLTEAARNLWDANYDDELARTHPRLLARFVILDNNGLLQQMLGITEYNAAKPHVASIRTHLKDVGSRRRAGVSDSGTSGYNDGYIYGSDSGFWMDSDYSDHDGGHDHSGHGDHDGGHSHCGHGDHGDDGNSGDGGDSGGDSGCGGCGGCGG